MTLGSLFDGAGTIPYAAEFFGIETLWTSEIADFPVAVSNKHFPAARQLGDIKTINGALIEPVDIIAGGSPCTNLSQAGNRQGINGEQSKLFFEMIRVIKEMRDATNGEYPRWIIFENVYGALTTNLGEDFAVILEEFCRIADYDANVPRPPIKNKKRRWSSAGSIVADGYSLAWRVLDAQFWGVPQRRRRVFIVVDLGGQCAGKVLFEREGLRRNFETSRKTRNGATSDAKNCIGAEVYDARGNGDGSVSPTMVGDHNNRITDYSGIVVQSYGFPLGFTPENTVLYEETATTGTGINENVCFTLNTIDRHGCVYNDGVKSTVRRFTPTECASLQGMPRDWCAGIKHSDSAEYLLWGNGIALPCILYIMEGIAEMKGEQI